MTDSEYELVRMRAGGRCEYCLIPAVAIPATLEFDHIYAQQHFGPTHQDNLAIACPNCNQHKGTNLSGMDRHGKKSRIVRLFHPRTDIWNEHFRFDGPIIEALTAIGRVTLYVLAMNSGVQLDLRETIFAEGWIPLTHPRIAKG